MRIAVLADLHANLPALRAVLDDVLALECDTMWCVGDIVGRGPHPSEVVDEMRALAVPTIQGNWDDAVALRREQPGVAWPSTEAEAAGQASLEWTVRQLSDDQRSWLRQLPARDRFIMEDRSVLLFHGSPTRQNDYLWSDRPSRVFARVVSDQGDDLMCFGNTHEAFHRLVGKSHFVAAGSVGCGTPDDMSAQYAVIDIAWPELMVNFRSVPYDHFRVEADMQAAGLSPLLLRMPPASHVALDAEADNLVEA
ncbi:MAG: metallophosphoesterase family protein [Candidatus Limnocylindria bacterium]